MTEAETPRGHLLSFFSKHLGENWDKCCSYHATEKIIIICYIQMVSAHSHPRGNVWSTFTFVTSLQTLPEKRKEKKRYKR